MTGSLLDWTMNSLALYRGESLFIIQKLIEKSITILEYEERFGIGYLLMEEIKL